MKGKPRPIKWYLFYILLDTFINYKLSYKLLFINYRLTHKSKQKIYKKKFFISVTIFPVYQVLAFVQVMLKLARSIHMA